jgi:hypothetical protein
MYQLAATVMKHTISKILAHWIKELWRTWPTNSTQVSVMMIATRPRYARMSHCQAHLFDIRQQKLGKSASLPSNHLNENASCKRTIFASIDTQDKHA